MYRKILHPRRFYAIIHLKVGDDMKKCPNCKMIVDADNECPFCYATITYEPIVNRDKEKYVFNKYFIWHLIKQCWFSMLCLIIVVIRLFCIRNTLDSFVLFPIVCLLVSLIGSLFGRKITKYMQWKYSEGYSEFRTVSIKYITGVLAILFSFVMH